MELKLSPCLKGTGEGPCLTSMQETATYPREQPGDKGPSQVTGDCSYLPKLPGVRGKGVGSGSFSCCTWNMVVMLEYLDFISSPQEVRLQ